MVKLLVMDVDGTLTDGKIYMGNEGELCKAFDIKDGCAIHDLLKPNGIEPVIITGRKSRILENRANELGISCLYQGIVNKKLQLEEVLKERDLDLSEVAYIGDDINDIECMQSILAAGGIASCPYDAVDKVKSIVSYVCKRKGGEGAVRDFIEWIIEKNTEENLVLKVRKIINEVLSFDLPNLPVGRHDLNKGSYFLVQEYLTKAECDCTLESHRKYVDVQMIMKGKEKVKSCSVDKLSPRIVYDSEKDIAVWEPISNMMETVLCGGSYIVLYPNDAHMPCGLVTEPEYVRKIVVKVRID